jgi:hypothetical protein
MVWNGPALKQGQGPGTAHKEEGFHIALTASLHISKGGRAIDYPYWHLDLNAGSGRNELVEGGCDGSPLIFLRAAIRANRRFNATFCDNDKVALDLLQDRIEPLRGQFPKDSTIRFLPLDNAECLTHVAGRIEAAEDSRFAVGTCLCDPNGYRFGFPEAGLQWFARRFPRIDLALSANVTLFRTVAGCQRNGKGFKDWPDYETILNGFNRPHWLLRNIREHQGPGHRFTVAVGRTTKEGYRKFGDFYPRESPEGKTILSMRRAAVGQRLLFPNME